MFGYFFAGSTERRSKVCCMITTGVLTRVYRKEKATVPLSSIEKVLYAIYLKIQTVDVAPRSRLYIPLSLVTVGARQWPDDTRDINRQL
jgi:hypothetical protein